ncbi:Ig-like domain-containing protein [Acinetobacter gerneri]|uniref:Ig-like domain-containing protein n=1 Tax=Acinetobacter gerneri TaxID=202952 RepID=UPI0029360726|nr:Ig-like domain-containing protein [Acinetobacter gerneri]MDV2440446.1 Ig-like domain-containing protein [Acinetobacter gerneri]
MLAVGGIAAVASSSGSSNSPQPKKPVLSAILEKSGNTISGETEANAVVTVMYNGEVIATATAGADGKYILKLDKNYNNGELLNISAVNKSTNVSLNTDITAPDTTAPSSLTQALSADNQTITGSTEAGAIVKVSLNGQVIGSTTANADGTYKVVLDKAYNNGEVFNITASDKAGNSTLPNTLVAPDTTAPSALGLF